MIVSWLLKAWALAVLPHRGLHAQVEPARVTAAGDVVLPAGSRAKVAPVPCPVCGAAALDLSERGSTFRYCSTPPCRWGIDEDVIVAGPEIVAVSHRFGAPT